MFEVIDIKTSCQKCLIDITSKINRLLPRKDGICALYVPHTSAAITINEKADPDVAADIINHLKHLVPKNAHYSHIEGNSDAHIVSSLIGQSTTIIVKAGQLLLGTWQTVFFVEFDGPRKRQIFIKFIEG